MGVRQERQLAQRQEATWAAAEHSPAPAQECPLFLALTGVWFRPLDFPQQARMERLLVLSSAYLAG